MLYYGRGRPRGQRQSMAEMTRLWYLIRVSNKYGLDTHKFLMCFPHAWTHEKSSHNGISIQLRQKTKNNCVFLGSRAGTRKRKSLSSEGHLARTSHKFTLPPAPLRPALSLHKCVRKCQVHVCVGALKSKTTHTRPYSDLVERPAKRHVAVWAGETTWPTTIHGRNDSSLVSDQGLKQVRTRHTQISYVFSTGVDS